MPPRAERLKPEAEGEPSVRTSSLDNRLAERATTLQMNAVYWERDLTPQLEILTAMGALRDEEYPLKPAEQRRLRRMIGLQMRHTPQLKVEPGDHRFWAVVQNEAGDEIAKAAGFANDLNDMPKSWQPAQNSLTRLQATLSAQRGE